MTPTQRRIAEYAQQLQKHLASFGDTVLPQSPEAELREKKAKPTKNAPRFDLGSELKRITGVDLTRIDGIDVMVAQSSSLASGTRNAAKARQCTLVLRAGAVQNRPQSRRDFKNATNTQGGC
jgi:hypothetical protein